MIPLMKMQLQLRHERSIKSLSDLPNETAGFPVHITMQPASSIDFIIICELLLHVSKPWLCKLYRRQL